MNRKMLRQAQELQAKLAKAQQELSNMTTEVSSGGGRYKNGYRWPSKNSFGKYLA